MIELLADNKALKTVYVAVIFRPKLTLDGDDRSVVIATFPLRDFCIMVSTFGTGHKTGEYSDSHKFVNSFKGAQREVVYDLLTIHKQDEVFRRLFDGGFITFTSNIVKSALYIGSKFDHERMEIVNNTFGGDQVFGMEVPFREDDKYCLGCFATEKLLKEKLYRRNYEVQT